jgi:hypothetical protein
MVKVSVRIDDGEFYSFSRVPEKVPDFRGEVSDAVTGVHKQRALCTRDKRDADSHRLKNMKHVRACAMSFKVFHDAYSID